LRRQIAQFAAHEQARVELLNRREVGLPVAISRAIIFVSIRLLQ
jgi:hypothetical protein